MNKEFIPYEQAVELKELGYDEPCMCIYDKDGKLERSLLEYPIINSKNGFHEFWNIITAPLYQQAFRWFREKHNLPSNLELLDIGWDYVIYLNVTEEVDFNEGPWNTYEEAELACLKKLIEIVKNK